MLWDHVCGNAGQWYHFWPTGMGVTINCARSTTGECASDSFPVILHPVLQSAIQTTAGDALLSVL